MAGLARRPRTPRSSALPAAPSSQRVTRLTSSARWRGGGRRTAPAARPPPGAARRPPGRRGDHAHGGELAPPDHRHHPPSGEAEHDLVGAGQGGAPACLGQGAGERLQPVPGAGRLLVSVRPRRRPCAGAAGRARARGRRPGRPRGWSPARRSPPGRRRPCTAPGSGPAPAGRRPTRRHAPPGAWCSGAAQASSIAVLTSSAWPAEENGPGSGRRRAGPGGPARAAGTAPGSA